MRLPAQTHAGRGAREDDVAGQQRQDRRELVDQGGHGEDQVAGAALLDLFTIDGATEFEIVGIVELVRGDQPGTDRGEAGKGLAQAELRCGAGQLGDPFGDVLADGETGDVVPGVGLGNVRGTGAHHHDQFDLPVGVSLGRQRDVGDRTGDAGGELGEDRRQALGRREPGLGRVVTVVETDREHLARGGHW